MNDVEKQRPVEKMTDKKVTNNKLAFFGLALSIVGWIVGLQWIRGGGGSPILPLCMCIFVPAAFVIHLVSVRFCLIHLFSGNKKRYKVISSVGLIISAVYLIVFGWLTFALLGPPSPEEYVNLGGNNFVAVSAGWSHSLALKSDGTMVGWGDDRWGMADPPDGKDFISVDAGTYYGIALKSDGTIISWGTEKAPPKGNDYVAIAAGYSHNLALKSDGSIVFWGSEEWGNKDLPSGNDFVAVSAGWLHSLALKSDDSIIGWGHNSYGEANPPSGNDFVAIAAGRSHSLALKSDGSIVGWGSNSDGKANLPSGNDFVAIAAGFRHNLALKSDGSIVGWGNKRSGRARSPEGNDFIAIAAGHSHSLALKSDGSIVGWGEKSFMEQPILHKPKEERADKEVTKKDDRQITEVIEIDNASSLKNIEPSSKTIRLLLDDEIPIDLVYIKPGSFVMGRDVGLGEKFSLLIFGTIGEYPDDRPSRKIKITKGFYIGKYKVTCAQFCKFLNDIDNPQDYIKLYSSARIETKDGDYVPKPDCENCIINIVPWNGAVAFCDWLSSMTGLIFRLPTEAEWEFTARGPEGRPYPWGDEEKENVKYYEQPSMEHKTYPDPWSCAPVDKFPENTTPDGVVGMIGRVLEWCSDFYAKRYLKDDLIDPQGPTEEDLLDKSLNPFDENYRVVRARDRYFGGTVGRWANIHGFRIVVEQPTPYRPKLEEKGEKEP